MPCVSLDGSGETVRLAQAHLSLHCSHIMRQGPKSHELPQLGLMERVVRNSGKQYAHIFPNQPSVEATFEEGGY